MEQIVAELLAEVAPELGPASPIAALGDMGVDSLAMADLAGAIEERFGVRLADGHVETLRTLADVGAVIRERPQLRRRIPARLGAIQGAMKLFPGGAINWFFRVKVSGAQHIPTQGPVVLAANHRSMWDVPIHVIASPRPIGFMAKQELYRPPFPAVWWTILGGFAVRREIADLRAIDTAIAVLEKGEVLGIYPEGKRSRADEMLPFLHGAAWLALRTGAPIVPTGISGTARRGPNGKRRLRRQVMVAFGPALIVDREDDPLIRRKKAESLTEELSASIAALMDGPEAARGSDP